LLPPRGVHYKPFLTVCSPLGLEPVGNRSSRMMRKVHFVGRVLPAAFKITVQAPEAKWVWQEVGLELTFRVKIGNSFINAECELAEYKPDFITELYRRAFDLTRASVNLVGFAHGLGLTVLFEMFIAPDGSVTELAAIEPSLPPLCTAYSLDPARLGDFNAVFNAVFTSPDLFMALEDLIGAITLPHVGAVNCARAMDRVKHLIATAGSADGVAWKQMRRALQIDEDYLKYVTDVSKGPRHGRPGHTPGNLTTEATRRSWTVMNRYFEYVKRGKQPLDAASFPPLK
jgi:hypothetical protein